jgi:hypothetical protein
MTTLNTIEAAGQALLGLCDEFIMAEPLRERDVIRALRQRGLSDEIAEEGLKPILEQATQDPWTLTAREWVFVRRLRTGGESNDQ